VPGVVRTGLAPDLERQVLDLRRVTVARRHL
jgi:hypothetical protein